MLQLSSNQLATVADARFERRLADLLAESVPDAGGYIHTSEGRKDLREQCDLARSYGFCSELDVVRFVITAWLMGRHFDTRIPAFSEILRDSELAPAQKSKAIEQLASTVLTEFAMGKRPA